MKINLEDYDYELPPEKIAQEAYHPRDECKFMILKEDKIYHKKFHEVIDFLEAGDVLVINETKVKRCKIIGEKDSGGKIEVTLVKKTNEEKEIYETRLKIRNPKVGTKMIFNNGIVGTIVDIDYDKFYVQFNRKLEDKDLELLTPPYIKNKVVEEDYQTVFANVTGSLAAPTAGLHFTPELLKKIEDKEIKIAKIQLDISFETFLHIHDVKNHRTGEEFFKVDEENAKIINSASGNIIAVGTTVVKCLESCNWKDEKLIPTSNISKIFIKPGHIFKAPIKAMITNFHLPKSSLLLLTCAYGKKERILPAYREAVKENYRFFSLGDAMMIFKK